MRKYFFKMYLKSFRTSHFSVVILSFLLFTTTVTARSAYHDDNMEPLASREITYNGRLFHKFVTRPDIDAPIFNVKDVYGPNIETEGCWFVAPHGKLDAGRPGPGWVGPHIYDNDGELVWSGTPMFKAGIHGISILASQMTRITT